MRLALFRLLMAPAVLGSAHLLLVLGGWSFLTLISAIGTDRFSVSAWLLGVGFVVASTLPLLSALYLLLQTHLKRPVSRVATYFNWAVVLTYVSLAAYWSISDPGDANWLWYPLLISAVSFLLAALVRPTEVPPPQKHGDAHE